MDWFEEAFGTKWCLRPVFWAMVVCEPLFVVTLDSGICGNYSGSGGHRSGQMFNKWCWPINLIDWVTSKHTRWSHSSTHIILKSSWVLLLLKNWSFTIIKHHTEVGKSLPTISQVFTLISISRRRSPYSPLTWRIRKEFLPVSGWSSWKSN